MYFHLMTCDYFVFHFSFQAQFNDIMDQCSGFELWVFSIFTCECVLVQFCTWICKKTNKQVRARCIRFLLQQHGRLREDRDFRGQRQPGDGEHQAGVLWAAAGPGERWLWEGMCGAQEAARKYTWHVHALDYFENYCFSLSAGFPSKKSCWSCSGQNICHESFEEGTYFYFSLRWQRELVATT